MNRLMMTVVVILVVVGVALATMGILHFRNTKDETGVTIDKKELKETTQEAVEKAGEAGGKILDKTGETLRKAGERLRGSSGDRDASPRTPAADDDSTRQSDGSKAPRDKREHESVR
jgi:hypothetical protein